MNYTYELTVTDNDGNIIYKRDTPFPENVERFLKDAQDDIEKFWADKEALASHDCGTPDGDGCEVCANYYEKHGGKDE
jgi:hypothetical protein